MVDDVAILIPAYEPDEKLDRFLSDLAADFPHVVVVDDGSSRPVPGAAVRHAVNRGKGAAIRTGVAWIRENLPDVRAVVTADADGQHLAADVKRVAETVLSHPDALALGARRLPHGIPFRSWFGNKWARGTFRLLTGVYMSDTQSGLRGISRRYWARLLEIPGDRYEYELRMLADACRWAENPIEVPIQTVYIAGNASSHFRPFRDALATQWALLRHCLGFRVDGSARGFQMKGEEE